MTTESEIPRFLNDLFQIFIRTLQPEVGAPRTKNELFTKSGRVFRLVENFERKISS